MNHNWYATITAPVLYSRELTDKQKILIAVISNLSNEKGYCFASNKYLADCIGCAESTLRQNLATLEDKKVLNRVITLNKKGEFESRALTIISDGGPLMGNQRTPDGISSYPPDGKPSHNNKEDIITNSNSSFTKSEDLGEKQYSIDEVNSSFSSIFSTVKPKKEKKKAEPKISGYSAEECKGIFNEVKAAFLNFYKDKFGTEYYFTPKDASKVYDVTKKTKFKMEERHGVALFPVMELINATALIITATYDLGDNWVQTNYTLATIDTKFNETYSKLKSGKHGNQPRQNAADATRAAVREAFGERTDY